VEWDGIHLGRYKGNDLVYAGKVDHGFTPQSEKELHDGFGSIASVWRCPSHFRFTPHNRRSLWGSAGPKGADIVLTGLRLALVSL
jgi:hypothetical protein